MIVLCSAIMPAIATAGARRTPGARLSALTPGDLAPSGSSPLAGMTWYVDPNSEAAVQEAAWQTSDPADAAEMGKIAAQPTAEWFGDWDADVTAAVSARVDAAAATGSVAELVAYDIPERDCGGYSSGGATSDAAYQAWIRDFATGIGSAAAVVVLEPDALAGMGCLSASGQAARLSLLRYAVAVLGLHAGALVYIDAGNSAWQRAAVMARRLRLADVGRAQGFSLNVSNFNATSDEVAYGESISARIGGKHFVIDTSRNGNGSDGQWCNPPGRALGTPPTAATGYPLVDAFLWIKIPGESDGTCQGGPPAGTWWPAYALGLARNAAF
jgi:endoglucanase